MKTKTAYCPTAIGLHAGVTLEPMESHRNLKERKTLSRAVAFGVIQLIALWASCGVLGQVIAPNFAMIGQTSPSLANLWMSSEAGTFPKQLAIDYTPKGIVYGFTSEYVRNTNCFATLKRIVQQEFGTPSKLEKPGFDLWRIERRKITVTLEDDVAKKTVRLIVVSVDKNLRSEIP